MIPVVFINCHLFPFVALILRRLKLYETRTRNTLRSLIGQRVILAETGRGAPLARCMVTIGDPLVARNREAWDACRKWTCIDDDSPYNWTDDTKVKYMYPLYDIQPLQPFRVPEGIRHGRVWMEYTQEVTA